MPSKGAVKVAVTTESVLSLAPITEGIARGMEPSKDIIGGICVGLDPIASDSIACGSCSGCGLGIQTREGPLSSVGGLPKLRIAGSVNVFVGGFGSKVAASSGADGGKAGLYSWCSDT